MYNLDDIKILLVDSQLSIRDITEGALKKLGIKNIFPLTTAEEALVTASTYRPDIIVVDHVLRPQDGVQFTRALRALETSVGLTPIIFTSAISAKERVYASRDAGITEFLARPFTADTLYKRLCQVIDSPRPFVHAHSFRGPDRRRRNAPPVMGERRSRKPLKGVRVIEPDNILRQKVGAGGLPPPVVNAAQLRMEEIRSSISFAPVIMESVEWQRKALHNFRTEDGSSHAGVLKDVHDAWSLMKGNAASFGFTLANDISTNLTDFLDPIDEINEDTTRIVHAHENALLAIIRKNIRDQKNPYGKAVIDELKKATDRYIRKYSIRLPE